MSPSSAAGAGPDEYAAMAPLYDPFTSPFLRALRRDMASRAHLAVRDGRPGAVLDVCCGTGAQLRSFRDLGLACLGTDLSPSMLARAARRAPCRVFLADAARLPLRDASVAVSCVTLALHEKPWDTAEAIFSEALRVASPEGGVLVADYAESGDFLRKTTPGSLAVKIVERLAGREHFARYTTFMNRGGLEGFLARQQGVRFEVRSRRMGLFVLAQARRA